MGEGSKGQNVSRDALGINQGAPQEKSWKAPRKTASALSRGRFRDHWEKQAFYCSPPEPIWMPPELEFFFASFCLRMSMALLVHSWAIAKS